MEKKLRGMVNVTFPLNENNNEEIKSLNGRIRDAVDRLPGLGDPAEGYNKTLSIFINENFVITEGPKWEKVKRGAKTAAIILPWILGGGLARNAYAAQKAADDNKASSISYTQDTRIANSGAEEYYDKAWAAVRKGDYEKAFDYRDLSKGSEQMAAVAKERADRASKLAKEKQIESHASSGGAGAAAGAAALLALKKDKKKKQEKKSLAESLNMVKLGMFLNEEAKISNIKLIDGEEPELIAMYSSWPGNKQEEEFFKSFYVLGDIYIGEGLVDYPLIKEKKTGHIYYLDLDSLKFDRSSITKVGNSINELKKDKKKKQEKKSLKERLNLIKSEMFLNEEDAEANRNE